MTHNISLLFFLRFKDLWRDIRTSLLPQTRLSEVLSKIGQTVAGRLDLRFPWLVASYANGFFLSVCRILGETIRMHAHETGMSLIRAVLFVACFAFVAIDEKTRKKLFCCYDCARFCSGVWVQFSFLQLARERFSQIEFLFSPFRTCYNSKDLVLRELTALYTRQLWVQTH